MPEGLAANDISGYIDYKTAGKSFPTNPVGLTRCTFRRVRQIDICRMMVSKLSVVLMMNILLASEILHCEGFAGRFPGNGKRQFQKEGKFSSLSVYIAFVTQKENCDRRTEFSG